MTVTVDPIALCMLLPMFLGLTILLMWLFIWLNLLCVLLSVNELVGLVLWLLCLSGEPLYSSYGLAFLVSQTAYYRSGYMNPAAIVCRC